MSQAIKCDRCGKYDNSDGPTRLERHRLGAVASYDLCPECDAEFHKWKVSTFRDPPKIVHGVNCNKIDHKFGALGFPTHREDDDGVLEFNYEHYCGRCHHMLTPQEAEQARKRPTIVCGPAW